MRTLDGHGNEIVDDAEYYVQDARSFVGNCGSWWAPAAAGYVCDIRAAGVFTGEYTRGLRDTDVPWPVAYVRNHVVHHVRVDTQAFHRNDKPVNERKR